MGKLGDLVVRIGADTKDLRKDLNRAQRNIRTITSNFTALGTQMTKAVTLPILGVGAMAIKSAADLEKMEVSFISLTGGAEQAGAMMQQLNEFTAKTPFQIDAVATSARQLIASGTGIGEVNEQLQFLGDIAATTGQPINEIAAIFAKVNAKGKVELENLNQLAERGIPVFKGLADATGLLPSELGAGAVTVRQFNDYLKSLSEEGGVANGAMERLSQTASGKFSTALDGLKLAGAAMAEDVLPAVNGLLDGVIKLAKKFTDLSSGTKGFIVEASLVAAAIGPLLILLPQIVTQITAMRGVMLLLNTTMMANPALLVAAGLAALVTTVVLFRDRTEDARKETDKFIQSLIGLDTQAQINAVKEQIRAKQKEVRDLQAAKKADEATLAAGGLGDKFDKQIASGNILKYGDQIDTATDSIRFLGAELHKLLNPLEDTGGGINDAGKTLTKTAGETKIFGSEIERLLVSFTQMPGAVLESKKAIVQLTDALGQTFNVQNTDALLGFLNDFSVATDDIAEGAEAIEFKFQGVATAMGTMFGEMVSGAQTGAEAFKSFAKNAISSVIAMAKANVIAAATNPLSPWNIAGGGLLAPAFALAGLSALDALLANIPALAGGGLAYGPSLAMVGDNRNASIDPEVIAPLSKLKDMMGASTVQVYGRISGDDIVISNSRASRDRNRF